MKTGQVLQCFLNADLRSGHDGLAALARKSKIDVGNIGQGEYVLFINSKKDKLKLYASNGVLAYLKVPGGLDMGAIALIPQAFNGSGRINYDGVLKQRLEKELQKRVGRPSVEVLGRAI